MDASCEDARTDGYTHSMLLHRKQQAHSHNEQQALFENVLKIENVLSLLMLKAK